MRHAAEPRDERAGLVSAYLGISKTQVSNRIWYYSYRKLRAGFASAARADALAALETLGLSRASAEKSLRKVLRAHPGVQTADELIRLALREN